MERYHNLGEIRLPDRGIDPKVANLVRGLVGIGVQTHASCEGHLDHGHSHPWVGINAFQFMTIHVLTRFIEEYNQESDIKWQCATNWILPVDTSRCSSCTEDASVKGDEGKLESFQENSEALGRFLFDRRLNELIQKIRQYPGGW